MILGFQIRNCAAFQSLPRLAGDSPDRRNGSGVSVTIGFNQREEEEEEEEKMIPERPLCPERPL